MKNTIGAGILILQLILIVTSRFADTKYYCWAPHDDQNVLEIDVVIDNQTLSRKAINQRYRLDDAYYWTGEEVKLVNIEARYVGNIKDKIRQYESTYGKKQKAEVKLTYWKNGGEAQYWTWPEAR